MPRSQRRKISGQTVMVTGAASGIGRALAQRLSRTRLPGRHRRHRRARPQGDRSLTARAQPYAGARRARCRGPDATSPRGRGLGARAARRGVQQRGRRPSLQRAGRGPEDDDWLWDINFHGVVNGTRAFLPILVEQNEARSSTPPACSAWLGMPNQSAYCSAKFAVRGFTDSFRQELRGTGVTAINVHPGGINTNIVRNARFREDPDGRGRTQEQMVAEFAAITMTQPDKAAEIIHRGVESGKARILVGPDAYLFDALTRWRPPHYYDVLASGEKRRQSIPAEEPRRPDDRTLRRADRRRRAVRHRRRLPPADRRARTDVRDPGGSRRHRRHLGPVPLPRRPVRLRHVHARLPFRPWTRRQGDRRRAVDPGYIHETARRVRHRQAHPLRPPRRPAPWSTADARWTVEAERDGEWCG